MLEQLEAKLESLGRKVHAALYRADEAGARAALAETAAALAAQDSPPEELEALQYQLRLLQFHIDEYFAGQGTEPEDRKAARAAVIDRFVHDLPEAQTAEGRTVRARILFQVAARADRSGQRELSRAEGEALVAVVSPEDRDNAFWAFLAGWAFDHRLADYVFEAYTEYLVRRKSMLSRYNWERLRLMYLLASQQAIFRDVEAVIDRIPAPTKAASFGSYLKPRCEEAGVWDERLQMMYELKSMDLSDRISEPLPPGMDRHFRQHPWDETEIAG
jgi:hypothetical protein